MEEPRRPPVVYEPTPLSIKEMLAAFQMAGVLNQMGEYQSHRVVVDYIPGRHPMALSRSPAEVDEPLIPAPTTVIPLTFLLEDAIFGETTFACVTCNGRVIVSPFPWVSYANLKTLKLQ